MTISPHLVVLEDDFELRSLVKRGLREEGFDVTAAGTASEMFEVVRGRHPDALVIDIGLPDADGRDVVQALRVQGVTHRSSFSPREMHYPTASRGLRPAVTTI